MYINLSTIVLSLKIPDWKSGLTKKIKMVSPLVGYQFTAELTGSFLFWALNIVNCRHMLVVQVLILKFHVANMTGHIP